MVEKKGSYIISEDSSGLNENSLLPFSDPQYQQPTPTDVRTIIQKLGLTGSEVAGRVGVSAHTVRKWQSATETSGYKQIPYSAWRLLIIEAGLVPSPEIDNE